MEYIYKEAPRAAYVPHQHTDFPQRKRENNMDPEIIPLFTYAFGFFSYQVLKKDYLESLFIFAIVIFLGIYGFWNKISEFLK